MRVFMGALMLFAITPGYQEEITKWRQEREAGLKAEYGWLSVSGLFWLKEAYNRVGASPTCNVRLPRGPANAAILTLRVGKIHLAANPGVTVTVNGKAVTSVDLQSDRDGATPDVIGIGDLRLFVIHRDNKDAIRLKDPEAPTRKQFTGLKWFPIQPNWKVEAKFVTYPKPKKLVIDTMIGGKEEDLSPGYAEFQRNGQTIQLEATEENNALFFVFRDKTAGKTTYPAARFLSSQMPKDGKVVLPSDPVFNRLFPDPTKKSKSS